MYWGTTVFLLAVLICLGACGGKSSTGTNERQREEITLYLGGGVEMEMVWIEPGTLGWGSDPGCCLTFYLINRLCLNTPTKSPGTR